MMRSSTYTACMSRRRFIAITAAAGAAGALPCIALGGEPQTFTWRGVALGAEASLTLQHHSEADAKVAIEECLAEVARLEAIFSLHRPNSAIVRLNGAGQLVDAPVDLRMLLAEALLLAEGSNGAFDPTIQPLWALYASHFGGPDASTDGPNGQDIAVAKRLVDWRKVTIDDARVRLLEPGMALTLNGIAQGYITDKIGDLLRARGFEHVLVNMGEQLALGPKWDGSAWQVGIADPAKPGLLLDRIPLSSGALATSGGYGYHFDQTGRFSHILDPRTGAPAHRWESVTVLTTRATQADGLSTALSVVPASAFEPLLSGATRVFAVPLGGGPGHWL